MTSKKKKPTDALVARYRAALSKKIGDPAQVRILSDKGVFANLRARWRCDKKAGRLVSPLNRHHNQTRTEYQKAQAARKRDPDVKEALARGRLFRWNLVKRVRRRYLKLAAPLRDAIDLLSRGGLNKIEADLTELSRRLTLLNHPHESAATIISRLRGQYFKVRNMLNMDGNKIRKLIGGQALARCSWTFQAGDSNKVLTHQYHQSVRRNGSFRTVTRANHVIQYRSFCIISPNGRELFAVGAYDPPTQQSVCLPVGYRWDQDALGLRIVRERDQQEYHPHINDWSGDEVDVWISALDELANVRATQARQELSKKRNADFFLRDLPNTRVTLRDSKRAGNCMKGSLTFAISKLRLRRDELVTMVTDDGESREMTEEDIMHSLYLHSVPAERLYGTTDSRAIRACWVAWERETTIAI